MRQVLRSVTGFINPFSGPQEEDLKAHSESYRPLVWMHRAQRHLTQAERQLGSRDYTPPKKTPMLRLGIDGKTFDLCLVHDAFSAYLEDVTWMATCVSHPRLNKSVRFMEDVSILCEEDRKRVVKALRDQAGEYIGPRFSADENVAYKPLLDEELELLTTR